MSIDPKQGAGQKKQGFEALPHTAVMLLAKACQNGADKYGPLNWLDLDDGTMSTQTYINAIERHWLLFKAGEDIASDSLVHHLDHIMAGCAVFRDAMLLGKVNDDRIKLTDEQLKVLKQLIGG
jgi:hypothetical protein